MRKVHFPVTDNARQFLRKNEFNGTELCFPGGRSPKRDRRVAADIKSPPAPADKSRDDFFVRTDTWYIHLGIALYADDFLGVPRSVTRLEGVPLLAPAIDRRGCQTLRTGAVHGGHFLGAVLFGMAGAGWAVLRNATAGTVTATFDEMVIRRRMQVYELEVERTRATAW